MSKTGTLTCWEERFVRSARVGHLATSAPTGQPHVVPVCFVLSGGALYVGLDSKPKSVDVMRLRRVRNLHENPSVAFMVDRYDEDWSRLGYVLVSGTADVCRSGCDREGAIEDLRAKYPQYRTMLPDDAPVIRIVPESATSWGDLAPFTSAQ